MTRPNRDLEQAGHTLSTVLAPNLTAALAHIAQELSALDGFPERGEQAAVTASSESTSVERTMQARYDLSEAREALGDRKRDVLYALRDLNDCINFCLRLRVPRETKPASTKGLCCEGQKGMDGAIEWGDALCFDQAMAKGLCSRHYQARRRWMVLQGREVEVDGSDLPVDALHVRITEVHGVAIVRDATNNGAMQ